MHEGPTENRLGELGSLYKYYYYYYYYITSAHVTAHLKEIFSRSSLQRDLKE